MNTFTLRTLSTLLLLLLTPYLRAQQQPEAAPSSGAVEITGSGQSESSTNPAVLKQKLQMLQAHLQAEKMKLAPGNPSLADIERVIAMTSMQLQMATATANPKDTDQARIARLEQEISDVRAMNTDPERIQVLQTALDWDKAHGTQPASGLFQFGGGDPSEFLRSASAQFHLPWLALATMPENQSNIRVPAFTLFAQTPDDILKMYNWLADSDPSLGKWQWQGDLESPDALILNAPHTESQKSFATETKVKAFSLAAIHPNTWQAVAEEIQTAEQNARDFMIGRNQIEAAEGMKGIISINKDTKSLVAIGSQAYIEMVESVISTFQANPEAQVQALLPPQGIAPGLPPPAAASIPAASGSAQ